MYIFITFLLVVIGLSVALLARRKMDGQPLIQEDPRKVRQLLEDFKQRARKVKVNLRECEVLSNSYSEDHLKSNNWRVQALDSLTGDGLSNVQQVNVNQSRVVFNTQFGAQKLAYSSPAISMDRTTLLLKLDIQNETTLYVDPGDQSKYYFDLEFLIQENQ